MSNCNHTFHRLGGIDDCPVCNPTDNKAPREFLVPSSWQIGGPKTESGDYVAVAKADYDKLQQELDAARDEIEEHVKNAEQWKRQYINEWANKKQVEKQLAEKQKELDAWKAKADKLATFVLGNDHFKKMAELEQKLVDAKAQIADYEAALEKIKKDTTQAETTMEANAFYLAEETLNKYNKK